MDVPVYQARKVSGRVLLRIYIGFWTVPTVFHFFFSTIHHLRFPKKKRSSIRLYLRLFVGGSMFYLRYLCLFVYSGVQHILLCFCFVGLRLVYPMLPVSLDCSFLIAPSVFSNVYLQS